MNLEFALLEFKFNFQKFNFWNSFFMFYFEKLNLNFRYSVFGIYFLQKKYTPKIEFSSFKCGP